MFDVRGGSESRERLLFTDWEFAMNLNEYFEDSLLTDPVYEHEDVFIEAFWRFDYDYASLHRHWKLNQIFINNHIEKLKEIKFEGEYAFESKLLFDETLENDVNYFPQYLRNSTIACAISLVENLLGSLSKELAADSGIEIDLGKKPMPLINKYILWFAHDCGMQVDINKSMWRELDAIRELRNRFIHNVDRGIPEQTRKVIQEMLSGITEIGGIPNDKFVDVTLIKLAEFVKNLELTCIEHKKINFKSLM